MKNEQELDDFLREKEEEFNIPFEEKYWEKASAFIEAERSRRVIGFSVRNIMLLAGVIIALLVGTYSYFTFNSNSSHKTELVNSTSTTGNNNSSTINNNSANSTTSTATNSTSGTGITSTSTNENPTPNTSTLASSAEGSNRGATGNNNTAGKTGSVSKKSSTGTVRLAFDMPDYDYAWARKEYAKTKAAAAKAKINSSTEGLEETGKAVVTNESITVYAGREEDKLNPVEAKIPYLNYHIESLIPVFSDMSVYDKTMASLYGLPTSSANHVYKRVQDIDHRFPLVEVSLTGGLDVFKAYDENIKNHSYLSTNPFIGARATYRWNAKNWFMQGQLNVMQQGGINQVIPATYLSEGTLKTVDEVMRVRHSYYVQLPVSLGYQIVSGNNKVSTVTAGLGIAYLVANGTQLKDDSTGKYTGSYKLQQNAGFRKMDCFVILGYTYKLNQKVSFSVSAQYGLVDATKNDYFGNSAADRNMNIGLGVNYSILKKKLMFK